MNSTSNHTSLRSRGRGLLHRTAGHTHGPITRLMSPGDLGERVKPFVFLDYFELPESLRMGMADHPHSGLATHTTLLEGSTTYRDSTEYVDASRVPSIDRVRVLLGRHGSVESAIPAPSPMTYLHVRLEDGERWRYEPAAGHDVAWVAVNEGKLTLRTPFCGGRWRSSRRAARPSKYAPREASSS